MQPVILIIEDEAQVRALMARYLEREGMTALTAADGESGLAAARVQGPDLVLLDVGLPDLDGWTILRRLREAPGAQPAVIMLTARSDEPDRVLGLELGADDYVVKPFSPREVVARVKAVLRRNRHVADQQEWLSYPGLRIDLAGRTVQCAGRAVALTPKEYDLLVLLARHPGRVLTRAALYDAVWGEEGQGDDHTLDVHVNRLRHKLSGDDCAGASGTPAFIITVKGIGFKFDVPHEES
jgi:DNA-binding response OmpR family regulator